MGMPGIGELAIIGVIIALIFGPKQIPKLGAALGETIREFRGISKELTSARDTLEDEVLDAQRTVRDALDPQYGENLALPPDPELMEDLAILRYEEDSAGRIVIRPQKEEIKAILGRSTDKGDSVLLSYFSSPGEFAVMGGFDVSPQGVGVQ